VTRHRPPFADGTRTASAARAAIVARVIDRFKGGIESGFEEVLASEDSARTLSGASSALRHARALVRQAPRCPQSGRPSPRERVVI